ncbi:MAG: hypothetical protein JW797_11410 [Bradymonadales bacterium]|nr:hypothetical protein [Bradymonadales bacterium]
MKFVCDHCGHADQSPAIQVVEGKVLITCPRCGRTAQIPTTASHEPPAPPTLTDSALASNDPQAMVSSQERAPLDGRENTPAKLATEGDSPPAPAPSASDQTADDGMLRPLETACRGGVRCPKCFHRQDREDYCERCGLDLLRAAERQMSFEPSIEGREEEVLEASWLWGEVEASLPQQERHQAYLTYCTDHGLLEIALRRYRERLSDHPEDQMARDYCGQAAGRLEKIALAMLEAERISSALSRQVHRVRIALLILAALLFVGGLILAILLFTRQSLPVPSAM